MPEAKFQKTWQVGEVAIANDLNIYIRDGYNYVLQDRPAVRATNTTGQVINSGLPWQVALIRTQQYEITDNTFSTNDRLDIVVPGLYLLTGNVAFEGDSDVGGRAVRFTKNGTALNGIAACAASPVGEVTALGLTRMYYFAKGDIVRLECYQDSGAGCGINVVNGEINALQAVWLSSATGIR